MHKLRTTVKNFIKQPVTMVIALTLLVTGLGCKGMATIMTINYANFIDNSRNSSNIGVNENA